MFITVTPLGEPPVTLNFHWVASYQHDEDEGATAITVVGPDGVKRTWHVEEHVEDISDLLALEGQYQEAPAEWSAAPSADAIAAAKDATGMLSPSSTALACIAFGEYLVEVRYEKQTRSIRPFLYSPYENKYLAGAIDANVANLAALVRELGDVLSHRIMEEDDLGLNDLPRDRSAHPAAEPGVPNKVRKSRIRLVKSDEPTTPPC